MRTLSHARESQPRVELPAGDVDSPVEMELETRDTVPVEESRTDERGERLERWKESTGGWGEGRERIETVARTREERDARAEKSIERGRVGGIEKEMDRETERDKQRQRETDSKSKS